MQRIILICLLVCALVFTGCESEEYDNVYSPFDDNSNPATQSVVSQPQSLVKSLNNDSGDSNLGLSNVTTDVSPTDSQAGKVSASLDSLLSPCAYNPWDRHLPDMPDDDCVKLDVNTIGGTLGRVFSDSNDVHLAAARALGIDPITGDGKAWSLKRPIVKVVSCPEYVVDDLSHSYPYLVPEAEQLLSEIGRRFNAELQKRGGGSYRLKVTSLLRTDATVARLRRRNINATETSAHLFATTFDISYSKFICDGYTVNRTQEDLKNLLAEVLYELRAEGRCYVKYERKQACFHITTRPAPPR